MKTEVISKKTTTKPKSSNKNPFDLGSSDAFSQLPPGKPHLSGGYFIIGETNPSEVFITEEWTEEQKLFFQSVHDFCKKYIPLPSFGGGKKELDVTHPEDKKQLVDILKKAAEMSYCGVNVPQEFGGLGLDFRSILLFMEAITLGGSIGTTLGSQNTIGVLPILFYGNANQKSKYLPKVTSGEWIAAYALTEPEAGSDAGSCRTLATPSPDGNFYFLSGRKAWVSNGGIADVFIVFAKIAGDEKLSAFIVEKGFPGLSVGEEETKMGLKGSSTSAIFFDDCMVPKENLLGERGKGFKIALNILNIGRMTIGSAGIGVAKYSIDAAIDYSLKRKQFGKPISEFGAIKQKIGQIVTRTFAIESALYRTGGNIDQKIQELHVKGRPKYVALVHAAQEFAIESSLLKVKGAELAFWATGESIQIHGAMGYAVDTGLEMYYRDARVLSIYEGTNEVNKLFLVGELNKRAFVKQDLDMQSAMKRLPWHLLKRMLDIRPSEGSVCPISLTTDLKMVYLLLNSVVGKAFGAKLVDEQEIVLNLSDILAEVYLAESSLLKFKKIMGMKEQPFNKKLAIQTAIVQLNSYEAQQKVRTAAKDIIQSFATGAQKRFLLYCVNRLTRPLNINPKALRRKVADFVLEHKEYPF